MSQASDEARRASHSTSTSRDTGGISPKTPREYQSIVKDEESEGQYKQSGGIAINASGTVRRTMVGLRQNTNTSDRNYGTLDEVFASPVKSPTLEDRAERFKSIGPTDPTASPSQPKLARKSSAKHAPHRGQEFSTDDDPDEYQSDVAHRRASKGGKASTSGHAHSRGTATIRRRRMHKPSMPMIDSLSDEDAAIAVDLISAPIEPELVDEEPHLVDSGETTPLDDNELESPDGDGHDSNGDEDVSDAESFTLKDKQRAINETHPFGIRIWKPALYKKNRSVEKTAEGDIHSSPGANVSRWLAVFNVLWTLLFGWWMALAASLGALVCICFAVDPSARAYSKVFWGLAKYLFFPFGKFVKLEQDEAYAEEDEGEGRSISEYEQWQQGDLEDGRLFFGPVNSRSIVGRRRSIASEETDSLLGRTRRSVTEEQRRERRARLFGRGQWTFGRIIFFLFFYFLIAPLMLLATLVCWLLVFWIPMARATGLLFYHLRRHPLALSFHSDTSYSRGSSNRPSSILLCTYRAVGSKYWKYTIDGTNIFLINLIAVVFFVIFDYFALRQILAPSSWIIQPGFIFAMALFSVIPLAYFIGQAVASISAQSSMGLGAAINAFFSTLVEVFLYCVALNDGKAPLVEGSIIGSIFAGILFLPGLSMCFGAIKRKTQRFNVKSAGVTSTMLLFATIACFGPTLFYQIYGSHELNCHSCALVGGSDPNAPDEDCRRCYFDQTPTIADEFFRRAVRPYTWFAAVLLFLSYLIGLWFTLRTHAAVIWNAEVDEKKVHNGVPNQGLPIVPSLHGSMILPDKTSHANGNGKDHHPRSLSVTTTREGQFYRRVLSQTLKQDAAAHQQSPSSQVKVTGPPHLVPPKSVDVEDDVSVANSISVGSGRLGILSEEDNSRLFHRVAEMAASAATAAAKDFVRPVRERKASSRSVGQTVSLSHPHARSSQVDDETAFPTTDTSKPPEVIHPSSQSQVVAASAGVTPDSGHDAPNWSRTKSVVILLGATVLYAIIAEILVSTVDVVLTSVDIDEKFLGITLFALVPNTTEFLNAISFAMNGNIALSMEIGSAYALQVFLLQIPALVLFSAITTARYSDKGPVELLNHSFTLIFPQWDMVTVILCVFLLSYVYGEGKSNYFKGSILVLTYLVIVVGFWLAGYQADNVEVFIAQERFGMVGRTGRVLVPL